jgi:hypothetical protein
MTRFPKLFIANGSLLVLVLLLTFAVPALIGQDRAPQAAVIDVPGSWTLVATTGPQARYGSAMAFDAGRGKVVLFGGFEAGQSLPGDTWEWDGEAWLQTANTGPNGRAYTALAYNAAKHRTVLFGGRGTPRDPNETNNDTGAWDGTKWTKQGVFGPSKRGGQGLAYDSGRQQIVLFGGSTTFDCGPPLQDIWELGSTTWTERLPVTRPGARYEAGMVYDIARGRTVLFGGQGDPCGHGHIFGDTWEWDGSSWMQVATTGPSERFQLSMAYDRARRRTVVFGGGGDGPTTGDTWEWDGVSWTQAASTGPSPRFGAGTAYDGVRRKVVLFGGADDFGNSLGDTWEWVGPIYACSDRAPGDLNCDRVVDGDDLAILQSARGAAAFGAADPRDLNRDGQITIEDAQLLAGLCTKRGCK